MIKIKQIKIENKDDANIPNQPFEIWGKMVPSLQCGKWEYQTLQFETPTEMCFPDFHYDLETDDGCFLGAYDGETCIGVAVLHKEMFKYLYLNDLKVNRQYRRKGVGSMLIEACMEKASEEHMRGIYVIGQDNNLTACLFYVNQGFEIGGFDNRVYRGTSQENKANIIFYRDC